MITKRCNSLAVAMQITLLPPLLPTEAVTPVRTSHLALTPGVRLIATVVAAGLDGGGAVLSMAGREVATGAPLPYEVGTRLRLEVTRGGAQPEVRVVSVDEPSDADVAPPPPAAGPPVSAAGYGFAAAVLAARDGAALQPAMRAMVRWVPALVASGVLTVSQGEALRAALTAMPWPVDRDGTPGARASTEALARAIADRVADGGLLLERRLGDVVRDTRPDVRDVATGDVRTRLAQLALQLQEAPPDLDGAREALATVQDALLSRQARAAALFARDGVVDVRIPLQLAEQQTELRLRLERDAPDREADADRAPWRHVRLDLALDGLGHMHVRLGLIASAVRAEFFVETPGAADRIEGHLLDLTASLEGAGFGQVLSRVVVDPVTARAPDTLPDLPQHAILDVEA